ncbi:unnamed protein product [Protopolystoma xenopodis]|uniref:PDEase domain-containing protein n=1 Tax=Protopolystoma xenopodis TaxID=117903 RepID=A0A448XHX9_9PLAT|nr:unnamed protein product [Protopolystoma xenopodis]
MLPTSDAQAVLRMCDNLKLEARLKTTRLTLARFLLMARRGYRDPPYHNWTHAYTVAHFIYLCLRRLPLMENQLTELEAIAIFVASLCHDIDHRGTNNSFQVKILKKASGGSC